MYDPILLIIAVIFMIVSMLVSWQLKRKFREYSETPLRNGMSGAEVAHQMLRDYRIYDVEVTCIPGELTDHYNPVEKTVNLSEEVYYGRNAAAAAVAAHECGHAVQHATAYSMLELRSALVPVQAISATILNIINVVLLLGGIFASQIIPIKTALLIIIACNLAFTLFAVITLPVEFDASKRALQWIERNRIVTASEYDMAKSALNWAALTYVVAALGAIAQLLYYVIRYIGLTQNED
ncbi:MAG: zinc metallopeptidase [Cytophagales bacterium]|nr:zinc metallopeptidase [Cytophagales bacterium]